MSFSLLLASSSPYRAEILAKLRIPFTQAAPDVDETPRTNETPSDYVLRLSVEKARALQAEHPEHWIIGSDQTCVVDGKPVGKAGQSDKGLLAEATLPPMSVAQVPPRASVRTAQSAAVQQVNLYLARSVPRTA